MSEQKMNEAKTREQNMIESKPNTDSGVNRRTALAAIGSASVGLMMPRLALGENSSRAISHSNAASTDSSSQPSVADVLHERLPKFSEASLTLLQRTLESSSYTGQISAEDAATIAGNEKLTIDNLMLALMPLAQSYSHAPISNFYVGVVVRGESGALYPGANIEIPGQSLGFAVHGEQSALSNAYMHGERSVVALAVGGAPCGHCRQFIDEMSPDGQILIVTPKNGTRKLTEILPEAFGPAALGMKDGAFPVRENAMNLAAPSSDPLTLAAFDAAKKSYAPYSKSPAGVALRAAGGRIFRGSYMESVAFNPSLSPLQVALAAMIATRQPYSAISAITLVELQGATISQRPVTEVVMSSITPKVKLNVVTTRI